MSFCPSVRSLEWLPRLTVFLSVRLRSGSRSAATGLCANAAPVAASTGQINDGQHRLTTAPQPLILAQGGPGNSLSTNNLTAPSSLSWPQVTHPLRELPLCAPPSIDLERGKQIEVPLVKRERGMRLAEAS